MDVILSLFLALSLLTTALVVRPPRSGLSVPIRLVLHPSCGESWVLHLLVVLSPSLCVNSSKSVAAAISSATPVSLSSTTSGLKVLLLLLLLLVILGLCGGGLAMELRSHSHYRFPMQTGLLDRKSVV